MVLGIVVDRENEDLRSEPEVGYPSGRLDSVDPGHRPVHDDDVRFEGPGLLHRFLSRRCFAHDLHLLGICEECFQAGAHDCMVIDQEYVHHGAAA